MLAQSPEVSSPPRHDDRRRHERIFEAQEQLRLVVDRRVLVTISWSSGGCLVNALKHWKVGDTVTGTLDSRQGVPMGAVILKIMRIDDQGRAALCFTTVAPLL